MAIVYAVKDGTWLDATVWDTGNLPGPSDDVYSNGYVVSISTDVEVNSISNNPTSGVSGGGRFAIAWTDPAGTPETITIEANILTWENTCLDAVSAGVSNNVKKLVVIGDIYGGSDYEAIGLVSIVNTSVYGNIYGGSIERAPAVSLAKYSLDDIYCQIIGDIHASDKSPALFSYQSKLAIAGTIYSDVNGTYGMYADIFGPPPDGSMTMYISIVDYDNNDIGTQLMFSVSGDGSGGSGDCPDPQHVRQGIAYNGKVGTLAVPMPEQVAFGIPVDQGVGLAAISLPQLSDITGDQIAAAFEK